MHVTNIFNNFIWGSPDPCRGYLFKKRVKNWSGEISQVGYFYIPRNVEELLFIVNWSYLNDKKVRVVGYGHNFSALNFSSFDKYSYVFISLARLSDLSIDTRLRVTAGTGISIEKLASSLAAKGLTLPCFPAIGEVSLGGALAVGAHGTGKSTGTMSNLVLSLTAVVWDADEGRYVLKTFEKDSSGFTSFLVNLGRSVLVDCTLQAIPNFRVRCLSTMDISAIDLFSSPNSQDELSFQFLNGLSDGIEVIWWPGTQFPWIKQWFRERTRPLTSVEVNAPYNYPFMIGIPAVLSHIISFLVRKIPGAPDLFFKRIISSIKRGLRSRGDLWGWNKDCVIYVRPSTMRYSDSGWVILTDYTNLQTVVYEVYQKIKSFYDTYGGNVLNGPLDIRVTNLDISESELSSHAPLLSPIRKSGNYTCAIWINLLTLPKTKGASKVIKAFEEWLWDRFDGDIGRLRVEWSKCWAYDSRGSALNSKILTEDIPNSFNDGDSWRKARDVLAAHDPHFLFSSSLLCTLFTNAME